MSESLSEIKKRWAALQSQLVGLPALKVSFCETEGAIEEITLNKGELNLKAKNQLHLQNMIKLVETSWRAGYCNELLGKYEPRFSKRILAWGGKEHLLKEKACSDEELESYCLQAAHYGFNELILGLGSQIKKGPLSKQELERFLNRILGFAKTAKKLGFKAGLDLSILSHEDEAFFNKLAETDDYDFVFYCPAFWHRFQNDPYRRLLTEEGIEKNITKLRKLIPAEKTLIYGVVPSLAHQAQFQAQSLLHLLPRLPESTYLAFSAWASSPEKFCDTAHPVWEAFRKAQIKGQLPLLPIFNPGGLGMGEGIWPTTDWVQDERLLQKAGQLKLPGAIALTQRLPKAPTPLDAGLYSFGASLVTKNTLEENLLAWTRAYQPQWKDTQPLYKVAKKLCEKVTERKNTFKEEAATQTLAELESFKQSLNALKNDQRLYFTYFLRDMKRLIWQRAQQDGHNHITLERDDLLDAPWTEASGGVAACRVSLKSLPASREGSEELAKILGENGVETGSF